MWEVIIFWPIFGQILVDVQQTQKNWYFGTFSKAKKGKTTFWGVVIWAQ